MQIYVSEKAARGGDGSKSKPYQTISEAAKRAVAGDEILVEPGIYRESVDPVNAGTSEQRITYRSVVNKAAVITGAEPVSGWRLYEGDVWSVRVPNGIFGEYNPYTVSVTGDWYWAIKPLHTGEVYLNGKSMYEVMELEKVMNPEVYKGSWDQSGTTLCWYTEQDCGMTVLYANFQGKNPNEEKVEINVRRNCFYPSITGVGYITLSGFTISKAATQWAPPTAYQEGMVGPHWSKGWIIEDCEISDSKCSGISLGKYLQPDNDNKWTTKYTKAGTQTERDAICQAQAEGWSKESIGSHIVRRCNIHDCGQTGIVGHLGGAFSVIEDNHIHHINNKQELAGAEIGGIKMHAAIDVVFKRNHIHHCTRGIWLDWQAQGTRVTGNVFHDNMPPNDTEIAGELALGEDIFVEVSHGPTLIDNNLLLSDCAGRLSTQGLAFVHNLIAGSFTYVGQGVDNDGVKFPTPRYTPYHMKHRTEVAGFMTILHGDARFYNNIFIQKPVRTMLESFAKAEKKDTLDYINLVCGTKPYDGYPTSQEYFSRFETAAYGANADLYYDHLPVYTGGNIYYNGAKPCDKEENCVIDSENHIEWEIKYDNGKYILKSNLFQYLPKSKLEMISTSILGEAFEPEQKFENPDGTPIVFNRDYFGKHRGIFPVCGPFEELKEEIIL
ncbi:MAG: right-handed parallel beta-helix repeat-containing protein [Hespellia sp.]|nr:right-handed parallel beta-helix repeat-containing protein [Hespellia sp.]